MANFTLTSSTNNLVGSNSSADTFLIGAAGRLIGADTVNGGTGSSIDIMQISATISLIAADFDHTRNIERLEITAAGGANITLANAMVASAQSAAFTAIGSNANDRISGSAVLTKALTLDGRAGNDSLSGGGGNDTLTAGTGNDTLKGNGGNDLVLISGTSMTASDSLFGGSGSGDTLRFSAAGNVSAGDLAHVNGFERIELLAGSTAGLILELAATLAPTSGAVLTVAGADGTDTISGGAYAGAMKIYGGSGVDSLTGGAGKDSVYGGGSGDVLLGMDGADALYGGSSADQIYGGGSTDKLYGGTNNDRLSGGTNNDVLYGSSGNDTLIGGSGIDTLYAGTGTDVADGGSGNDTYYFSGGALSATDLIADESGTEDVLRFSGTTAVALLAPVAARISGIERVYLTSGSDTFEFANTMAESAVGGKMTVYGGSGNDYLTGAYLTPIGTPANLLMYGGSGSDSLIGGKGNDTLDSGTGGGVFLGDAGNDLIVIRREDLAQALTINGGAGNADTLRITTTGTITDALLANVQSVERIDLSAAGNSITLSNALFNALGATSLTITGSSAEDVVDASALTVDRDTIVYLGAGDDTYIGGLEDAVVFAGPGADNISFTSRTFGYVAFGIGELNALDRVIGSATGTFDRVAIGVASGSTLLSQSFQGLSGIERFVFNLAETGSGAVVRLPSNLVTTSGATIVSLYVDGPTVGFDTNHSVLIDGRSVVGRIEVFGNNGNDTLLGGVANDTLNGGSGANVLVGGDGRDFIGLFGDPNSFALITDKFDGSRDMAVAGVQYTPSQIVDEADSVTGAGITGNFIAVSSTGLGLSSTSGFFLSDASLISYFYAYNVLPTTVEIAGNNFGSRDAVKAVLDGRFSVGTAAAEKTVIAIGGSSNTQFGVYLFIDNDNNTTIDAADELYLLAMASIDVPTFGSNSGITATPMDF